VSAVVALSYRNTSRELRRLDSVSRSPIYSKFSQTLSGATIIRAFSAFGAPNRFRAQNEQLLDDNQRVAFVSNACSQWLSTFPTAPCCWLCCYPLTCWLALRIKRHCVGFRLQCIGVVITAFVCYFAVWDVTRTASGRSAGLSVSAATVGLALAYALPLTDNLNALIGALTETEKEIVSVERVLEYMHVTPEEPLASDEQLELEEVEAERRRAKRLQLLQHKQRAAAADAPGASFAEMEEEELEIEAAAEEVEEIEAAEQKQSLAADRPPTDRALLRQYIAYQRHLQRLEEVNGEGSDADGSERSSCAEPMIDDLYVPLAKPSAGAGAGAAVGAGPGPSGGRPRARTGSVWRQARSELMSSTGSSASAASVSDQWHNKQMSVVAVTGGGGSSHLPLRTRTATSCSAVGGGAYQNKRVRLLPADKKEDSSSAAPAVSTPAAAKSGAAAVVDLRAWPSAGALEARALCLRYRPELDCALRDVTFTVRPAERVGIVGRTGAGL
jgi:ABC-type multidrug transport system fused ATPase/permease subunit